MLPAKHRLRQREDFAITHSQGDRHHGKLIKIKVLSLPSLEPELKVGFVVSKKVHKKAVVRNRIKRQLRAIFRSFLTQLSEQPLIAKIQIIVTVVSLDYIPSYQELQADLINLLNKSGIKGNGS